MNVRIWLARDLSAQDRAKAKDVMTPPTRPRRPITILSIRSAMWRAAIIFELLQQQHAAAALLYHRVPLRNYRCADGRAFSMHSSNLGQITASTLGCK